MARKPFKQPTTQAATSYGTNFPQKTYAGAELSLKVVPIDTYWYITIQGPKGVIYNRKSRLDLVGNVVADLVENWGDIIAHSHAKHDHLTHATCPLCKQGF